MTLETQVADLTTQTTALLTAVNVQKSTLDTSVSTAAASASSATSSASAAGTSAGNASTSATNALNSAGTAGQYSTALAAIASQTAIVPAATVTGFNGVIVANFIYDTKKDSDGGAWRKRCQNTSWYNETTTATGTWRGFRANETAARAVSGATTGDYFFNTTDKLFYSLNAGSGVTQVYRGSRREFPEVVGITVESGRVILWDLTDATMPMWKSFITTAGYALHSGTITSIRVLNGIITVGMSAQCIHISLIDDRVYKRDATNYSVNTNPIGSANTAGTWTVINTTAILAGASVNSVAATVLSNAPIDNATGLPIPTIYVGVNTGVSRIASDGTVSSTASAFPVFTVWIDGDFVGAIGGSTNKEACMISTLISLPTGGGNWLSTYWPYWAMQGVFTPYGAASYIYGSKTAVATSLGVYRTVRNGFAIGSSLNAAITNAYNSGWMNGDIRGAWLADTVAETVSGTELVTNGAFAADIAGWTDASNVGSSIAWNAAGKLDHIITTGGTTSVARQTIANLIPGKAYCFSGSVSGIPAWSTHYFNLGTTLGGLNVFSLSTACGAGVMPSNTWNFSFIAPAATLYLQSSIGFNPGGQVIAIDNISVIECAEDRSNKANPLTVVGTLTKAAVASGAQLMAYSGFSAANYLEQAYSANLNFGTTGFSVMGWIKVTAKAAIQEVFCRDSATTGIRWTLDINTSGFLTATCFDGTTTRTVTGAKDVSDSTWHRVTMTYSAGTVNIYLDGVLHATATGAALNTLNNATAVFRVGLDAQGADPATAISFALVRVSATIPSADQIAYMYETERKLFEPGAQCCIAGTSTAVTAVAYDDSTNLLQVGTSWGYTELKGLKAVNSAATTVGALTALSSSGGYKLIGGATGAVLYKPSALLIEELARTAEQRAAYGSTLIPVEFDAVTSQVAFVCPLGYSAKHVYSAGTLKRIGSTKDYLISNDGFRDTVTFAAAPGNTVWVSILCTRSN